MESISFDHNATEIDTANGPTIKISFWTEATVAGSTVLLMFHFYLFGFDYVTDPGSPATTTTTTESDETITVRSGAEVKFDVDIQGWPFQDSTNTLEMDVRLISVNRVLTLRNDNTTKTQTTSVAYKDPADETLSSREHSYMIVPTEAVVDGVTKTIDTQVKEAGNQQHILLIFPYFQNSLHYDPVLGLSEAELIDTYLLFGGIVALLVVAALVVRRRR